MPPQLPFDVLYFIFSLLPSHGLLYREDQRLYDSVQELGIPVPLTRTKDLASCAAVSRAWNVPARRLLLRDIRVVSHAHCKYLINLASDPAIGRDIWALEFINGRRRPELQSLRADITPEDVVNLVKKCPRLRTLTLFGCPLHDKSLESLAHDATLDEIITLGLSRQAFPFTLQTMKRLLDRLPQLQAFACPTLVCHSEYLPPPPTTKLRVLIKHQNSNYSFWLLNASAETLVTFDPEFHSRESTTAIKSALGLTGRSVQRIRIPCALFVSELLPLCPNLRHLTFPISEWDFEQLLASISTPLESLTLLSDHYIGRKAKATLSASHVRLLLNALETEPMLRKLKFLDLSLTYHEDAYPFTPVQEFASLKALCSRRGIQFPCPDVSRLVSGPRGANPRLYGDIKDFEDTWE